MLTTPWSYSCQPALAATAISWVHSDRIEGLTSRFISCGHTVLVAFARELLLAIVQVIRGDCDRLLIIAHVLPAAGTERPS